MASSKEPVPPDDELTQKLRAAARRRRPGSPAALLLVVVVLLGPLVLFVWWTLPGGPPPRLTIVASDQLALPGEETTLRAFLVPIEPTSKKLDVSGYEISFEERVARPSRQDELRRQHVHSQADGSAVAAWRCPEKTAALDMIVRYLGDKKRRGAEDRARLFAWPADTPLLLVDVPSVLSPEPAESWHEKNILDISPRQEAGKVLQQATSGKYRIAYLALSSQNPFVYRKYRGWVMHQSSGPQPFPPGPVLGKTAYEQEEGVAWEDILRSLKQRFRGPMLAVVGTARAAAVCRAVGIRTILLGQEKGSEDVVHITSLLKLLDVLTGK